MTNIFLPIFLNFLLPTHSSIKHHHQHHRPPSLRLPPPSTTILYPPRPMEIVPAVTSMMLAVRMMEEKALAPERSATRAKRTDNLAGNDGLKLQRQRKGMHGIGKKNQWWKFEEEDPVGLKFDEKGKTLQVLDGRGGQELESMSEVVEHGGRLWVGSAVKDYVVVVKS